MAQRPVGPDLPVTLANPRADRVAQVRALAGRSARRRSGHVLVEGPQAVREAVRYAPGQIVDLYVTPDAAGRAPEIVAEASASGIRLHGCSPEVADAMSRDAQGCVAVVRSSARALADVPQGARLVAVLVEARDPGNAGTVIRAADAAGADAVILTGASVEVRNPKVIRASAGSVFHLPVIEDVPLEDAVAALRSRGLTLAAADGDGEVALGADGLAWERPTAWLFGNEAHGLPRGALAAVDARVRIPIYGHAESLNLAAAATLCLYASASARRARA